MYDILIRNILVCDGTGAPAFPADVGISAERIVFIGNASEKTLSDTAIRHCRIIDGSGKILTPGFIDPHTHADLSVLLHPEMEPYLKQGVTTVVTGNCGYSMAPQGESVFYWPIMDQGFAERTGIDPYTTQTMFFERKRAKAALKERFDLELDWHTFKEFQEKCAGMPLGCNQANLVGHSAIRTAAMGMDCLRAASEGELAAMKKMTREAMEAGAFGISTGRDPVYLPGPYGNEKEIRGLLQIVKEYDGIFASHTKNWDAAGRPDRIGGYMEMMNQCRDLGIRTNISHVHVMNMAISAQDAVKAADKTLSYFQEQEPCYRA